MKVQFISYSTTLFVYNLYLYNLYIYNLNIHPPIRSDRTLNTQTVRQHKLPCKFVSYHAMCVTVALCPTVTGTHERIMLTLSA
jgi:hypothetical protein